MPLNTPAKARYALHVYRIQAIPGVEAKEKGAIRATGLPC
jgi:hypothetical protein